MIQKVKEKVKDTAKASLEEVMETAFSNFTMELQTAKEEMESLVGDSGSAHQQRPSMDDLERYMKMKNSVLKKAQAELNAGEMVGKDALCTNCYPFEEWLNVEGVPKAQHLPAVRHPHVPDQVPRPGAVLLPAHHPRSMSRPAVVLQVHLPAQQPTVHRPRQAVQAGLRPAQQASGRRPLQAAMHMPQVLRVSHLLPDGRIRLHVPPLHICLLPGLPGLLLRGRGAPPGKRPHLPTCQRADGERDHEPRRSPACRVRATAPIRTNDIRRETVRRSSSALHGARRAASRLNVKAGLERCRMCGVVWDVS